MVDNLRNLVDERRKAMEDQQGKVDTILGVVTRAAEGDLTGNLSISGSDTIGKLAQGVQRMVDNLGGLVNQVQQSGIQVTSSATEIAATAKQQAATAAALAAEQIKQAMIQLNEAAQQTVDSLRQSNSAIERLNDAAHGLQTGVTRFKVQKRGHESGSWLASA